jgi:hypothetical protein
MSNLNSARQALKAELDHARKGAAFYESRVVALEDALDKIDSVESGNHKASDPAKLRKPASASRQAKPGRKAGGRTAGNGATLPSTGRDFWPNLITAEPRSAREILDAAIKALNIAPSKEQLKKLTQRQTSALHNMIKTNVIADSGAGRERRFFKRQ